MISNMIIVSHASYVCINENNTIRNEILFWNKDEERSNCNFPLYVEGVNCIEFSGIYGQMLIYSQMFYIILLVSLESTIVRFLKCS